MSLAHFPSMVEGHKRGWVSEVSRPPQQQLNMTGMDNKRGLFHKAQMAEQSPRINNKVADDRTNELYYLTGGIMGVVPKPQPQGSFARPLNLSGNTNYGARGLSGGGGTMRTQAGQRYGIALLQRRAKQLNELEAIKSGQPLPASKEALRKGVEQIAEQTPTEKKKLQFESILDDIINSVLTGEGLNVKPAEVRKLYTLLGGDFGRNLTDKRQINKYERLVHQGIVVFQNDETYPDWSRNQTYLALNRVYLMLKCLNKYATFQPRERLIKTQACHKFILKETRIALLDRIGQLPPALPPSNPPSSAPPFSSFGPGLSTDPSFASSGSQYFQPHSETDISSGVPPPPPPPPGGGGGGGVGMYFGEPERRTGPRRPGFLEPLHSHLNEQRRGMEEQYRHLREEEMEDEPHIQVAVEHHAPSQRRRRQRWFDEQLADPVEMAPSTEEGELEQARQRRGRRIRESGELNW